MIRFIYGRDLGARPRLARSMFLDRAGQFQVRRGWQVRVDAEGCERDQYDRGEALYCIYELPDGTHGGSGRLLPTTGPTMVNDHFSHLAGGELVSPLIWESTRFCVSPRLSGGAASAARISAALMLAGCEVALRFGLSHYVAVFDAPLRRIFRSAGWAPEVIAESGAGRERLCLGLWEVSEAARGAILSRAAEDLAMTPVPSLTHGAPEGLLAGLAGELLGGGLASEAGLPAPRPTHQGGFCEDQAGRPAAATGDGPGAASGAQTRGGQMPGARARGVLTRSSAA